MHSRIRAQGFAVLLAVAAAARLRRGRLHRAESIGARGWRAIAERGAGK